MEFGTLLGIACFLMSLWNFIEGDARETKIFLVLGILTFIV